MELDLTWLLLGLPLAFGLGWAASRMDMRQVRRARDDSPRAYFKGLNLLLNEQQDKAIDAFIEAVQNDPDTTELHFALGNLFRRRGEIERAVRVHQHLLNRADIKALDRDRAQLALAQDYMKAGLFDRAEAAWRALEGTRFDGDAQLALLSLFERSRDWEQAAVVAVRLEAAGGGSYATRIAHYQCELAEEADAQGRTADGDAALQRAQLAAPLAPRPGVLTGRRLHQQGRYAEAMRAWEALRAAPPGAFLLVASEYAASARACQGLEPARRTLEEALSRTPAIELLLAIELLEPADAPQRVPRLLAHLHHHPSLSAAQALLRVPQSQWNDATVPALEGAIAHAARPLQRYRCAACAFEAQHYFWQCPGCLAWDSYPPQRLDAL